MKTIEQIQNEIPYADVMTVEEFLRCADSKCFIPYDGEGRFHDGENETEFSVWDDCPAGCRTREDVIEKFPYVCWYNK